MEMFQPNLRLSREPDGELTIDAVTFTPDGTGLVVANEGEPAWTSSRALATVTISSVSGPPAPRQPQ